MYKQLGMKESLKKGSLFIFILHKNDHNDTLLRKASSWETPNSTLNKSTNGKLSR